MEERRARFRSRVTPVPDRYLGGNLGTYSVETFLGSDDWKKFQTIPNSPDLPYMTAESCVDEVHLPPYRIGGPFRKVYIEHTAPFGVVGVGNYYSNYPWTISGFGSGTVRYTGGFNHPTSWPGATEDVINISGNSGALGLNSPLVPSTSTLESRVWDKTKPKLEQGGLAVAIAELRDLPRMLQTTAKGFLEIWDPIRYKYFIRNHFKELPYMVAKRGGNHFLNHAFGWVPFINDLHQMCENIIEVDKRIDRLMFDNGEWVRRKAILVNQSDEAVVADSGDTYFAPVSYPASTSFVQSCFTGPPRVVVIREKRSYAYGVGRYRYYRPELDKRSPESQGMLAALRRQLMLHGARITPANVYKATPWTWLIDWVSDTGRTVSALNDFAVDGLVAKYLCLVHRQDIVYRQEQFLPFNGRSGGPVRLIFTRKIVVKQRKEAEAPFGFGLSWDHLSPKQLAILAALGITRH